MCKISFENTQKWKNKRTVYIIPYHLSKKIISDWLTYRKNKLRKLSFNKFLIMKRYFCTIRTLLKCFLVNRYANSQKNISIRNIRHEKYLPSLCDLKKNLCKFVNFFICKKKKNLRKFLSGTQFGLSTK